jgi:hypothetical protein
MRLPGVGVLVGLGAAVAIGGMLLGVHHVPVSDPADAPPGWVVMAAVRQAVDSGDAAPVSARWALTTGRAAAPLVGLIGSDPAYREYVVILRGHFTAKSAPPGVPPPTGDMLVFTLDPATHVVNDLGVVDGVPDAPGVEFHPLALPV